MIFICGAPLRGDGNEKPRDLSAAGLRGVTLLRGAAAYVDLSGLLLGSWVAATPDLALQPRPTYSTAPTGTTTASTAMASFEVEERTETQTDRAPTREWPRGCCEGTRLEAMGPSGPSRSPRVFASKIGIEKSAHAVAPAGPGKRPSTQDGSHDSFALTPVKTATRAFPQAYRRIGGTRDDLGGRAAI